jgi:nickel-type superoxide dismutase maturation protease
LLRILKVRGASLAPEFQEGDFVVVSKIPFLFRHPRPGEVVAFRQPQYGTMLKRVTGLSPDGEELIVLGDHPWSTDSRSFGPVRREAVLGKVILHVRIPGGEF